MNQTMLEKAAQAAYERDPDARYHSDGAVIPWPLLSQAEKERRMWRLSAALASLREPAAVVLVTLPHNLSGSTVWRGVFDCIMAETTESKRLAHLKGVLG